MTNNILSIFFVLNITLFNPLIWPQYFSPMTNHIMFLGHVQVGAQLGMLGVLLAYIEYKIFDSNKKRFFSQIFFSLVTMFTSYTSAAYIAMIFLIVFWLLNKTRFYRIFTLKGQIYVWAYLVINCILFYIVYKGRLGIEFAGFSLNGRGFIWSKALESFFKSPIYGYGAHGVLIKVFWSSWIGDGQGMNYMHNQMLQVLNDGGIILLIPFIVFLFSATKRINKISDKNIRFWIASFTLIILIIMLFESTMEYFYIFYILCMLAYLPNILSIKRCQKI